MRAEKPPRKTRRRRRNPAVTRRSSPPEANCGLVTNYYRRIHGRWLAHTRIPPTETRFMHASILRKQVDAELDAVIRAQRSGAIADLRTLWTRSVRDGTTAVGLTPLLLLMTSLSGPRDISMRIGWMNRHAVEGCPLQVFVDGAARDRRRCRIVITEGTPCIGSPEYWLWDEYAAHRAAYAVYVRALARLLGMPVLRKGYRAEAEFAAALPNATDRPANTVLTWSELRANYTTLDWTALLVTYGLREDELAGQTYELRNTGPFLHRLQSCMRTWSPERWRGWFALLVAQWFAGTSPHGPLRSAWFAYTQRHLYGARTDVSPADVERAVIQQYLPDQLGEFWVRAYGSARTRQAVRALAERIRRAAIAAIQQTAWLAPSTRAVAVYKLQRLAIEVGWPDVWTNTVPPTFHAAMTVIDARLTLDAARTDRTLEMLRSANCRALDDDGAWDVRVFDVNAFYYPTSNRMFLPAGILRAPFYDARRTDAWNYGAIGATIGHEICHAFDAEGRDYDADGRLRNWWTDGDRREYDALSARMVALYASEPYRGLSVDGRLTLVENIADVGGLEFALAGLRDATGHALTPAELREFFHSFAYSWQSKDRRRTAATRLLTDTHAPPMLRVNHTLRQIDEWYGAYAISADCAAFVPPSKRVRFFGAAGGGSSD